MGKLIGYARVSTRAQDADRQIKDLIAAGVRRDDLYVDHGVSGARASRPLRPGPGRPARGRHPGRHHPGPAGTLHREHARPVRTAQDPRHQPARAQPRRRQRGHRHPHGVHGLHRHGRPGPNGAGHQTRTRHRLRRPSEGPPAGTSEDAAPPSPTARSTTPAASSTPANPPPTSPGTWACPGPPSTAASPTSTPNNGSEPSRKAPNRLDNRGCLRHTTHRAATRDPI